jgi:hypothetical protein
VQEDGRLQFSSRDAATKLALASSADVRLAISMCSTWCYAAMAHVMLISSKSYKRPCGSALTSKAHMSMVDHKQAMTR